MMNKVDNITLLKISEKLRSIHYPKSISRNNAPNLTHVMNKINSNPFKVKEINYV